jgi:DNA replication protein DnaC
MIYALSEAKSNGTLSKLQNTISRAELLILDEFGYVPVDTTGAQLLFDIVAEHYEQKSILLNTNLEFSHWVNILYDPKMTAALIERMLHHCHLLIFSGPDIRIKESSINNMYSKIAEDMIRAAGRDGKETTK